MIFCLDSSGWTIGKGVGLLLCKTIKQCQVLKTNNNCDKCLTILSFEAYRNGRMPRTCTISETIHVFSFVMMIKSDQHLSESVSYWSKFINCHFFYCGIFYNRFHFLLFTVRILEFSSFRRQMIRGKMTSHAFACRAKQKPWANRCNRKSIKETLRPFKHNLKSLWPLKEALLHSQAMYWAGAAILSASKSNRICCCSEFNWHQCCQLNILAQ